MKKAFLLFFLIVGGRLFLFSQVITSNMDDLGIFNNEDHAAKVTIVQDVKLESILKGFIQSQKGKIPGYRVQIFMQSGTEARERANAVKYEFNYKYPDYDAYPDYLSPYFVIRVGDFRTKTEAQIFKKKIESNFSNSYIVECSINLPKL
jgi:hypothetical protein